MSLDKSQFQKMDNSFKKFNEFITESLVILSMKGLMTNEFKNNIQLNRDFENARRIMYEKTSSIFEHIEGIEFNARTLVGHPSEEIDAAITIINNKMERMKFERSGKPKRTKYREWLWIINCSLI